MAEALTLRSHLRELYFGVTPRALRFQGVLVALDVLIIGFFVVSQFIREASWFYLVDYGIALFVALDLAAKLFALGSLQRWLRYPTTWIDLVVLATLLVPALLHNWGFLRILRLWTLVHRERFWQVLGGGRFDDTSAEDVTKAVVNLVVFVFLAAGLAHAFFLNDHPKLQNFLDALYFVVTVLTTTGLGDITIDNAGGRVFSIALMLCGLTLFFSLAQAVLVRHKRAVRCEGCGLDRHEEDARHCKRCGAALPEVRARAQKRH